MAIDRRSFLAGLAAAAPVLAGEREGSFAEAEVYRAGDAGYHTYRIPSLLATGKGALLAFAEARKNSSKDSGDIDVVVKRSENGGRTWSPQSIVSDGGGSGDITIGNPCPVIDHRTRTILLPFSRNNEDVFVTVSQNDGRTWSTPLDITASVKKPGWTWYATGPGVGIQVHGGRYKGRLIIPCDHREDVDGRQVKVSHVFFSDDHGKSWALGGSAPLHTDECQVAELSRWLADAQHAQLPRR